MNGSISDYYPLDVVIKYEAGRAVSFVRGLATFCSSGASATCANALTVNDFGISYYGIFR